MKTLVDKEERWVDEVFADEALEEVRRASLAQGIDLLSRRRRHRRLAQACLLIALLTIPAFVLVKRAHFAGMVDGSGASAPIAQRSTPGALPDGIELIGDRELLALFPGETVALVGEPGRQRLLVLENSRPQPSSLQ